MDAAPIAAAAADTVMRVGAKQLSPHKLAPVVQSFDHSVSLMEYSIDVNKDDDSSFEDLSQFLCDCLDNVRLMWDS